jgi:hypothetical protein
MFAMKTPDNTEPESWHRFFGASANNTAWDLTELPSGEFDALDLLDSAHAAAWHWQHVGNELNRMRALMLLALAHAKTGLGASAFAYAEKMRSYFLYAEGTSDWEIAFVHVVHAHASWTAGEKEIHARSYSQAAQATAGVADDNERGMVQRVFRHVPEPEAHEKGQAGI